MIHAQALVAVTGELARGHEPGVEVLRSPGLLRKHYAPRARLMIWSWSGEAQLREQVIQHGMPFLKTYIIAHTSIPSSKGFAGVSVMPHNAEAFARALYAELHRCDEAGAECIIVEAVPENDEWGAVSDRLNRAAAT